MIPLSLFFARGGQLKMSTTYFNDGMEIEYVSSMSEFEKLVANNTYDYTDPTGAEHGYVVCKAIQYPVYIPRVF